MEGRSLDGWSLGTVFTSLATSSWLPDETERCGLFLFSGKGTCVSDRSVPVDFLGAFQIMTCFCSYKEIKATS